VSADHALSETRQHFPPVVVVVALVTVCAMPHISKQCLALQHLEKLAAEQKLLRYISALFSDLDDSEEEDMEEEKDLLLLSYYAVALSSHYLFPAGKYRTQCKQGMRLEWENIVDGTIKYNDEEFLGHFRVD